MFGDIQQIVARFEEGEKLPDPVSESEAKFRQFFAQKYKDEFLAFAESMRKLDSRDEREKCAVAAADILAYLVAELMKKAELNAWATTVAQEQAKDMRQEGLKPN